MPASNNTKVRTRRTQEERSTETQDKIIRGAAKCIVEPGYKAATMKGIAEAAGVTWGAIQHDFGDKENISHGVTELGAMEFKARTQRISLDSMSLSKRVDAFLEQAREQTEDELYRASIVIFRNKTQQVPMGNFSVMKETLRDIWLAIFGDIKVKIGRKRFNDIKDFTYMSVNAIAVDRMSFEKGERHDRSHFKLLGEFLIRPLNK